MRGKSGRIFLSWMTLGVGLFEVVDVEFCVVFEGGKGLVAEEFFDVVEVGIGADHFGGAGAAEGVRGDVDIELGLFGVTMQPVADSVGGEWVSVVIEEDFGSLCVLTHGEEGTCAFDVVDEMAEGCFTNGYHAFFVAFAGDFAGGVVEIDVLELEFFELTNADSGRIQEFQDSAVSDACRCGGINGFDDLPDLGMGEDGGG